MALPLAFLLLLLLRLDALKVVQRNMDGETGAFAFLALDLDPASVTIDNFLDDSQADAKTAALTLAAFFSTPESFCIPRAKGRCPYPSPKWRP